MREFTTLDSKITFRHFVTLGTRVRAVTTTKHKPHIYGHQKTRKSQNLLVTLRSSLMLNSLANN